MKPTALVVTTVHASDDTRIRERLVRSLATEFDVVYASRRPGPTDSDGLVWHPLEGGRVTRNLRAASLLLRRPYEVAVVHDPELIPAAVIAALAAGKRVVFDVHEDLASQIKAKAWIPRWARPVLRTLARFLYSLAERFLILTLAEESYVGLFKSGHPVFANYPRYENWPDPAGTGDGSAVYVGDTQPARGVDHAVAACLEAGVPLKVVGPVTEEARTRWTRLGVDVVGRLPNPEALEVVRASSVALSPLSDVPNYRHSVPTKTVEYLALGVPVVATALPGTASVLSGWEATELVPPGDVSAMAKAISMQASAESKRKALQQSADVRARYVWPEAEVLDFYRSFT